MNKIIFAALSMAALFAAGNQHIFAQAAGSKSTDKEIKRINKVKKDLADIGIGRTITVSRVDNRDFFGRVKAIGENDFEITETDSKVTQIFKYQDIKNVRSGDGSRNFPLGQRANPQRGWLWGGLVIGAVLIVSVIGLSQDK